MGAPYETEQVAPWGYALAAVLATVGVALGAFFAPGPVERGLCVLVVAVAGVVGLFAKLRVRVTDVEVRWTFGLRWLSKAVPLAEVRDVRVERAPWYWGWGIRWTPRGWMWRANGLDVTWLELADGRRLGVGAKDPSELAEAIRARQRASES